MEGKFGAFLFLFLCVNVTQAEYVVLLGPRIIPQGGFYKALLSSADFVKDEVAVLTLTGHDNDLSEKKTVKLENSIQEISLKLSPTLKNYTLVIEVTELKFKQSVDIYTIAKRYSVLIQTDKAVYKPGDTVHFRVLVMNHETKPYQFKTIKIEFITPVGQVITEIPEEFKNVKGSTVVNSFTLSDNTILGNWTVRATVDKETDMVNEQRFEVKEYVLPRYELTIKTKPQVRPTDKSIIVEVYGKYTFGEFMSANVSIVAESFDPTIPNKVQNTKTTQATINAKRQFTFDIRNDLKIVNTIRAYEVKFKVKLVEILTGQEISKELFVVIRNTDDFNIKLVPEKPTFKPGFPLKVRAIVTNYEGALEENPMEPVSFRVTFDLTSGDCKSTQTIRKSQLNFSKKVGLVKGIAELSLDVPKETVKIAVSAKYFEAKKVLNVKRFKSNSNNFLDIKLPTSGLLKIGDKITVEVRSNEEMDFDVFSVVMSRSGIVSNETHNTPDSTNFNFPLTLTADMAPSSQLLVFYVQSTGEIIYDRVKLDMMASENKLEIQLDKSVKPGMKARIQVESKPNSQVFLLGVDKSVRLLGTGNDIDKDRLIADLLPYSNHLNFPDLKYSGTLENRYQDLADGNIVVLTNAVNGSSSCLTQKLNNDDIDFDDGDQSTTAEVSNVQDDPDFGFIEDGINFDRGKESKVRKNFAETWMFRSFMTNPDGKRAFFEKVPDTMTSYVVTGFSIHPEFGLGLASPGEVEVKKEFFIKPYIPYSIRVGEVLKVDVTVFNYVHVPAQDRSAVVIFKNLDRQFEFVKATPKGAACRIENANLREENKTVTVPANNGASAVFLIRALKSGNLTLKIKATMGGFEDEIEKLMLVESEGRTVSKNFARLIDLREHPFCNEIIDVYIPPNVVENSISIDTSVIGDVLGPLFVNVDFITPRPHDCPEQTFVKWVPNIATLRYLRSIGKLTPQREKDARSYLNQGYQKMMKSKQPDGSFEFWSYEMRSKTSEISVWLTAYMVKLMNYAKRDIPNESRHIADAKTYIRSKQNLDGSFRDPKKFFPGSTEAQKGVPLAAFIAIAFMESGDASDRQEPFVNKALTYTIQKAFSLNDNYALAISSYALALNKHTQAHSFIESLISSAIRTEDGMMYWYRKSNTYDPNESVSVQIEIAAYAALALITQKRYEDTLPIFKWLMTQRNSYGGFESTQDSVIGIQALAMIVGYFGSFKGPINIKMSYERGRQRNFLLDSTNGQTLQHQKFDLDARNVSFVANGSGIAYFQLYYNYYLKLEQSGQGFSITTRHVTTIATPMILEVCVKLDPVNGTIESGMTLIEVQLPSGYVYDSRTVKSVEAAGVKRTQTLKGKTLIVLYLDSVTTKQVCPQIVAVQQNVVTDAKQSEVKVYDYTNTKLHASSFYSPPGQKPCGFGKV